MRGFKMVPNLSSNSSVSEDQVKSQTSDGTNQSELIDFNNPNQQMIDKLRTDGLVQTADQMQKLKAYNDHQNNKPDGFFANIYHNMTGPANPYLYGGGGGLDLIGGRGLAKGALNAVKHIFKSGAKTAVKQQIKKT